MLHIVTNDLIFYLGISFLLHVYSLGQSALSAFVFVCVGGGG